MEINELIEIIEKESQRYCSEFNIVRNDDWFLLKIQEELGELTQKYLMLSCRARQKGMSEQEIRKQVEIELADLFCVVLLFAKYYHIDVMSAIEEKWIKK